MAGDHEWFNQRAQALHMAHEIVVPRRKGCPTGEACGENADWRRLSGTRD